VDESTLEAIRNLGFRCFRPGVNAERHCPWKAQTPEKTAFMQGWDIAEKSNEPEEYVEYDNEF